MATTNTIQFSQFNASLNSDVESQLVSDLSTLDNNPDVLPILDLQPEPTEAGRTIPNINYQGQTIFQTGFIPDGAAGGSYLTDDAEGLTIYYGKDGTGYLLASSQGDSTFVAYTREGNNDFLGRFAIGSNGAIDSVQNSDGADVINVPLGPNFPFGLFVTQDGNNLPADIVNGQNVNTNFKLVPWENIANAFENPLVIDTTSYNPRTPIALGYDSLGLSNNLPQPFEVTPALNLGDFNYNDVIAQGNIKSCGVGIPARPCKGKTLKTKKMQ